MLKNTLVCHITSPTYSNLKFFFLLNNNTLYCIDLNLFYYNCQPRGYISEGERTIDIQLEQGATLHMITTRVIMSQFIKIGHNRHRMGTRINSSLSQDWRRKANTLSGNRTRARVLHKQDLPQCLFVKVWDCWFLGWMQSLLAGCALGHQFETYYTKL